MRLRIYSKPFNLEAVRPHVTTSNRKVHVGFTGGYTSFACYIFCICALGHRCIEIIRWPLWDIPENIIIGYAGPDGCGMDHESISLVRKGMGNIQIGKHTSTKRTTSQRGKLALENG